MDEGDRETEKGHKHREISYMNLIIIGTGDEREEGLHTDRSIIYIYKYLYETGNSVWGEGEVNTLSKAGEVYTLNNVASNSLIKP